MTIPPVAAEPIGEIFGLTITNSMVNAWILVLFFILVGFIVRRKKSKIPRGIQNVFETITEFFLNFIETMTHDKERARRFLPIVGSLFLFILLSNWMGIIPGTGSIGIWEYVHGELELVPVFRPASSDLNLTLAMAIFSVLGANILGIAAIGFFKHLNKFIQIGTIMAAFRKGGVDILVGIIEFGVGLIELVSEVAKVISLSLRLFGNIFAGEVLLTVIGSLVAFVVPLPFIAMELIVGIVQAMVFSLLTLVYLTVATEKVTEH